MRRTTVFLWIALGGALLQLISLGSNFYVVGGETKDAWFGIPHTSDLLLASGVITIVALGLTAWRRMPMGGRLTGVLVGIVGLLAAIQVGYRMITPPFGGCLQYGCAFEQATPEIELLVGIWIALGGSVAVAVGGFAHALSRTAAETAGARWAVERQPGMNPWLGLAAIGAVAQFVFPFTFFDVYRVQDFLGQGGATQWGGWLSIPHTSSLVLATTIVILALVVAAGRGRSPLAPTALGAVIATLGFLAGARILYRLVAPPFETAGGTATEVGTVAVQWAGYLGVVASAVVVVAGLAQVLAHREPAVAGEPALERR